MYEKPMFMILLNFLYFLSFFFVVCSSQTSDYRKQIVKKINLHCFFLILVFLFFFFGWHRVSVFHLFIRYPFFTFYRHPSYLSSLLHKSYHLWFSHPLRKDKLQHECHSFKFLFKVTFHFLLRRKLCSGRTQQFCPLELLLCLMRASLYLKMWFLLLNFNKKKSGKRR